MAWSCGAERIGPNDANPDRLPTCTWSSTTSCPPVAEGAAVLVYAGGTSHAVARRHQRFPQTGRPVGDVVGDAEDDEHDRIGRIAHEPRRPATRRWKALHGSWDSFSGTVAFSARRCVRSLRACPGSDWTGCVVHGVPRTGSRTGCPPPVIGARALHRLADAIVFLTCQDSRAQGTLPVLEQHGIGRPVLVEEGGDHLCSPLGVRPAGRSRSGRCLPASW